MTNKYVVWFKEVDKHDIAQVGGKGANLGEMIQIGIPVPPGFIVTAQAYFRFLADNQLHDKLQQILNDLDTSNSEALNQAAKKCQTLILNSQIPQDLGQDIIKHYLQLGKTLKEPYVAVRSSATAEDLPTASFAGQQESYLNIRGEASVVYHVRKCWASLFTARAIFYRVTNKFDHFQVGIAVPIQKMVQAEKSGIMFTINPVTDDKSTIVIEAILGLGELIVQGAVTPDHYEVDKKTLAIMHKKIGDQDKLLLLKRGKTIKMAVASKDRSTSKISDEEIKHLSLLGKKLEQHYYFPQDIEWAIDKNNIYIIQTRPITTIRSVAKQTKYGQTDKHEIAHTHTALLKGDAASPGVASGPVKILHSVKEIDRIKSGDVLVAKQTNPDFVPAMRKAVAIVTETGGRTSHAAIVSRELGIPAIVGATGALTKLKDGQIITVHGSRGVIYKGGILTSVGLKTDKEDIKFIPPPKKVYKKLITATKVYVNLAEPERVNEVAAKNVDGVGLLRAEFMIAGIGTHPKKFIKDGKSNIFVQELSTRLKKFCSAFNPRPVVYRATDFRTNEYRNLKGGELFEPEEVNPMLGYRGAYRYISDPAVFELELEAIKTVRNKYKYKNLHLMIPYVHTPQEMREVKRIIAAEGLLRSPSFKLWMMVELPANVILLEEFLKVGIDGVSIGSNDLTMLILGVDRDNSEVAQVFDEMNPAVLWAIQHTIKTCHKYNITVSICGQAPSDYPELVEKLVHWGITSISVNRDVVEQVRETVFEAEKKIGK